MDERVCPLGRVLGGPSGVPFGGWLVGYLEKWKKSSQICGD